MSVVPLTEQAYRDAVGHIENFLAGVTLLNEKIINDVVDEARKFINSLEFDIPNITPPADEEEPISDPSESQEELTVTTGLTPEFLATLTKQDMQTGGHRTRQTAQGLIQWTIIRQFRLTSAKLLWEMSWTNQTWKAFSQVQTTSITAAENIINQRKVSFNAEFVMQFDNEYYLLREGHVSF